MLRYPKDTEATAEDCVAADPDSLIELEDSYGCSTMWTPLSSAATSAIEAGNLGQGRVLWLLADCASMMLKPASLNSPYGPMFQSADCRSALVEDFLQSDLELLAEIVELIRNENLRARVSDILWLARKPRQFQDGIRAAECYSASSLNQELWYRSSAESFERAIVLCRQLGSAASSILKSISDTLYSAGLSSNLEQGLYGVQVFALLLRCKLLDSERAETAANHLRRMVDGLLDNRDYGRMREAAELLQQFLSRIDDSDDERHRLQLTIAESWASQAADAATPEIASNIAAVSYCNNAIQAFREVPRSKRETLGVDVRIEELQTQLAATGTGALDEMGQYESEGFDISDLVTNSISQVEGCSVGDALYGLARITAPPDFEATKQQVIDLTKEFPIATLFGATHFSRTSSCQIRRRKLRHS